MLKASTPEKGDHRLAPYTLFCTREPLSGTLGPPDYFPQTSGSAEESLSRETCLNGYKEVVEGVEEQKEATFSLAHQTACWTKPNLGRYKEAIHKRLRAVNVCLGRKLKIGQVYGVPLAGPLLLKPGLYPEQRLAADDSRRKWLDDVTHSKSLRLLSDQAPTGVHFPDLLELAAANPVPLLRASWCIRVIFLNAVRPTPGGFAGPDKAQARRNELWTKEILEVADMLLSAICGDSSAPVTRARDTGQGARGYQKKQVGYETLRKLSDHVGQHGLTAMWQFVVCLTEWHCSQGLLNRSTLIEFTLKQLTERESVQSLELLLPLALFLLDGGSTPQTQIHSFVRLCAHWLQRIASAGSPLQSPEQPRLLYLKKSLVEVVRYFLKALPPLSSALDCFPLLKSSSSIAPTKGFFYAGILSVDPGRLDQSAKPSSLGQIACSYLENAADLEQVLVSNKLLLPDICEAIEKGSSCLSKAVKPGYLEQNECRILQGLDQAFDSGDVRGAVRLVFGETSNTVPDGWVLDLYASCPSIYCSINPSQLSGVVSLCEWAACDFREHRDFPVICEGGSAVTDMSRIYLAVSALCLKIKESKDGEADSGVSNFGATPLSHKQRDRSNRRGHAPSKGQNVDSVAGNLPSGKHALKKGSKSMHNLIVAWLDQHETSKGNGLERLQLLIAELVRSSLFVPASYIRLLVSNGILEKTDVEADYARSQRHRRIVKLLPMCGGLDSQHGLTRGKWDARHGKVAVSIWNEMRIALFGIGCQRKRRRDHEFRRLCQSCQQENAETFDEPQHPDRVAKRKASDSLPGSLGQSSTSLQDLKQKICTYLRLPEACMLWKSSRVRRRSSVKPAVSTAPADVVDLLGGCEGCNRMKRMKTADGREAEAQGLASIPIREEDWWSKHPQKGMNTLKAELSVKQPTKQTARGRPKIVRKTQSLAHLAATCPEDVQGSLSTHRASKVSACLEDNQEGNIDFTAGLDFTTMSQTQDIQKGKMGTDLFAIGSSVRDLRLNDRWELASWLNRAIRKNMGKKSSASTDVDAAADGGLLAKGPTLVDVGFESGWHMDEEQFKAIVYLLHMTGDLRVLLELLLWLLPVVSLQRAMARGITNRNASKAPSVKGDSVRMVGEANIMSFIRRYDTALAAMDLLPQALSTGMRSAEQMLVKGAGGKASCRAMLSHVLYILKKYGGLAAVQNWESMWKVSGDKQVQAELDALKAADPDGSFGMLGRGPFDGDAKHDDPVYLRLTGRAARIGAPMKEIVQRLLGEAAVRLITRAKEFSGPNEPRDGDKEVLDATMHTAQRVVQGLLETIRQNGGSPVDPSLVAAAVAAVVGNVGNAVVSVFGAFVGNQVLPGPPSGLVPFIWCARHVIQMHVSCVCYLKDVFGEHQSRLLEVALASEAGSLVLNSFNRAPRMQILTASDACDIPAALSNESAAAPCMALLARPGVIPVAAVAAFVAGAVVQGMISLDRVVTLLRINDGLEALQVSFRVPMNVHGTGRTSVGGGVQTKAAEANLHWFRVLVGNCRSISAGLVTALLGESNALGLAQLQRAVPLTSVLPSAYCLFSIALHKQASYFHASNRDDSMFQAATMAVHDIVSHQPFREVCFRDTRALYSQLSVDAEESEHAAALDNQGLDISSKLMAILPLRARLFLYAILEGKVSECLVTTGEKPCSQGVTDHKCVRQMNVYNHTEELVKVLDNLHPATFHWQWVELRMLLNEQVILEKLESGANMTAVQALQAALASPESRQLTECEKTFTEIVLTRLLVRPDAAALYSEVLRSLGRAFEEYLILQVKWVLEGTDMLFGRKSLRQVLDNYANRQGLSVGSQSTSVSRCLPFGRRGGAGVTFESPSRQHVKTSDSPFSRRKDRKCDLLPRQYVIEKALAEMVLPCLVRSSADACCGFAVELAKQLTNLEQHLSMLCRMSGRPLPSVNPAENYNHKALVQQRGSMSWYENGSPGVGRKSQPPNADSQPVYAAAIQASVWLRLQFLMPLLPIIQSDREQTARNLQVMLVPALLRLLDTRVLQEPPDHTLLNQQDSTIFGADGEWVAEAATSGAAATAGEWVFDRLVAVLHFISNTMPSAPLDQEVAERTQVEMDQAQVSPHLLTVMRTVPPAVCKISAAPPQLLPSTSAFLQSSYLAGQASQGSTLFGKDAPGLDGDGANTKQASLDADMIDPWSLLEDAAVGASMTGGGMASSSDSLMTLKSTPWLRGAIRERRRDSIYAGAVEHDA